MPPHILSPSLSCVTCSPFGVYELPTFCIQRRSSLALPHISFALLTPLALFTSLFVWFTFLRPSSINFLNITNTCTVFLPFFPAKIISYASVVTTWAGVFLRYTMQVLSTKYSRSGISAKMIRDLSPSFICPARTPSQIKRLTSPAYAQRARHSVRWILRIPTPTFRRWLTPVSIVTVAPAPNSPALIRYRTIREDKTDDPTSQNIHGPGRSSERGWIPSVLLHGAGVAKTDS